MPARSIWKGSISFGLVQIPVALYPAECPKELSFHLLDKHDLSPIHFQRISAKTGKPVDYKELVKGYKTKDGTYVVMTDQDFKRANVEATQTVDILDFVDASAIDPVYFDKPYFLAPVAFRKGRPADSKAYALLRETLRRTGKVGIAKVVIRTREHIAALMPYGNVILLNLLRFAHELRDADEVEVSSDDLKKAAPSPKEIKMAEQLVLEMSAPWEPRKYRDEYRDDLLALIRKKVKAGNAHAIDETEVEAPEPPREVADMLTLLKQSLEQSGKGRKPSRAANRNQPRSAAAPRRKSVHTKRAA